MSSISGIPPIAAYLPTAVAPAQPTTTSTTTDNHNNSVTLNAVNFVGLSGYAIENLTIANELSVGVTGDNNNVTVNEYNILLGGAGSNPTTGSASPSVLPTQNADGTITLNGASPQDGIKGFIQQELLALLKATKAYGSTANTPSTNLFA